MSEQDKRVKPYLTPAQLNDYVNASRDAWGKLSEAEQVRVKRWVERMLDKHVKWETK